MLAAPRPPFNAEYRSSTSPVVPNPMQRPILPPNVRFPPTSSGLSANNMINQPTKMSDERVLPTVNPINFPSNKNNTPQNIYNETSTNPVQSNINDAMLFQQSQNPSVGQLSAMYHDSNRPPKTGSWLPHMQPSVHTVPGGNDNNALIHASMPFNPPPVSSHLTQSNYPRLSGPPTMPMNPTHNSIPYPGQQPLAGSNLQSTLSTRVDSEMLPSVIHVLEQNQEKAQEAFITNAPGLLPPLVGTNFICQDQGSCNPRFVRSTVYSIPNTAEMTKQSRIPLALSISPFADLRSDELEPPIISFDQTGPIRCQRCKAYMCSYMQFTDGGKRFICCFCEAATDVPNEYFNHLDHNGRRIDFLQRPELCLGAYEILATKNYCKDEKWPEPPAFIFMIDVSYNSIHSGFVDYICHILRTDLLNYLPIDRNAQTSNVRVGFATFDKQIHFYNIKNTLGQPQMMVVSDIDDIFVPLLDGFLCSPEQSRNVIDCLLEQIPKTFANTKETETILAPTIQAGIQALKASNRTGKIYLFASTLPIAAAPGKLSNRDDKKLLGTDKEKILFSPIDDTYAKLGEECALNGWAIDLFVFTNNYYDLATIGEVCRLSGGDIYKFNSFSAENDGEYLYNELKHNLTRTTGFDALMRVRTNTGIRPIDFLGNFHMTNATEMIFGTINSDKSVCVELKHDDKLPADNNTYVQVALLYTSISGQRRLRILTLALKVTSTYTSLYPACDLDTILNYLTKIAVRSIQVSTPKSIRDSLIIQSANMLACYRKYCTQTASSGQLVLPETLKLLPIYIASLVKSDVLAGTLTVTTDERSWLINRLMSMSVKATSAYLYPRIYSLNFEQDQIPPSMIRCSYDRFSENGAYVIENGLVMYIWIGIQIDPVFVQNLFNCQVASLIQTGKCRIPELDNPISVNVRKLLSLIRNERNSHLKLHIIQQRGPMEPFFKNILVEDKGITGGASYVDFLYSLHREIRNIL